MCRTQFCVCSPPERPAKRLTRFLPDHPHCVVDRLRCWFRAASTLSLARLHRIRVGGGVPIARPFAFVAIAKQAPEKFARVRPIFRTSFCSQDCEMWHLWLPALAFESVLTALQIYESTRRSSADYLGL